MVRAAIPLLLLSVTALQDPSIQKPGAPLPDEYVPKAKGPALGLQPIEEAKEVYLNGRLIGRGVTLLVPKTAANERYFYSHSRVMGKDVGAGVTTIESWSDRRGIPIRAIYIADSGRKLTVTTLVREGDNVLVKATVNGKEQPLRKIPLPKDLRFQFSQFHPMDVRDCAVGQPAEFSVVDPLEGTAKRYTLTLTQKPDALAYKLTANGFTGNIDTAPDGRLIRSETSAGLALVAVEPTADEWQELERRKLAVGSRQ